MERVRSLFLRTLKAAIWDEQICWEADVTSEELQTLLEMAMEHHVLPMIFEAVYTCPAAARVDPALFAACRHTTVQTVMGQAVKTEEFLDLYRHLRARGLMPLVVKGIVCRSLYPKPDHRSSGDEDVLCGEHQNKACQKAMVEFGMEPCGSGLDNYETPFRKEDGGLYIELHKTLFREDSDIFGACNRLFDHVFQRPVMVRVGEDEIWTMAHTDHMLYLIVHAFKHFLHCGFGIRQVCDMVLFADRYGDQVDWKYVQSKCRSIRCHRFAAALFRIGERYLGFDPVKACYPRDWATDPVDERGLLEDLLDGGIYGSADRSRVHSSNMTLNAVAEDMKGKRAGRGILRTLFPAPALPEGRFPYLRTRPYLLPVAWTCRIFGYARERISDPEAAAGEVIRTGSRRIALLREYEIID